MEPGKKLRILRKRAGLSQSAAAELIGCHQTLVGAIERGDKHPGIDVALGIEQMTRYLKGGPIRVSAWSRRKVHAPKVLAQNDNSEARL